MLKHLYQDKHILIAQSYQPRYDDGSIDGFGFNLGLHVGDNPSTVLANRCTLLHQLQSWANVKQIVWVNQVHGADVYYYPPSQSSALSPLHNALDTPNADALWTHQNNTALAIMTADCVPIALFDDKAVACIHAGWQGLVAGVIKNTVLAIRDDMSNDDASSHPISAYIGACISGGCYEVPLDMANNIAKQCLENHLTDTQVYHAISDKGDGKAWLDVAYIARLQLQQLGVTVLNETVECSYQGEYHSHRRATHQHTHAGRMAMIIARY